MCTFKLLIRPSIQAKTHHKKKSKIVTPNKASIVTEREAYALFEYLKKEEIPYEYVQGNCHNLSHCTSFLLRKQGINTMKIWAFAPSLYSNTDPTMITVKDKNSISLTETIDWRYHVATVLLVKGQNGIVEEFVIDLALFPKAPVYYRTWLVKFKTQNLIHLFTDAHWYLFNTWYQYTDINATEAEGLQLFHEEPSVKLPKWFPKEVIYDFFEYELDCKENHWLEKGLAINSTAYQFFVNEIYPKQQNAYYSSLQHDYKLMVGDVYNFETIFRDYSTNDEMTEHFQEKHAFIIEQYRLIYHKELDKWKSKTLY